MTARPTGTFTTLGAAAGGLVGRLRPARTGVETWSITDRAAWLARRQKDVTASAAGALLGVHDYLTPYALWALKSGLIQEDPEESPVMVRGRLLEPVALRLLQEQRPDWQVWTPGAYWRDPAVRLGATPDALAIDPARPGHGVIQVKTVEPSVFRRKWRAEDGAVEPPVWIAVQAMVEAHLTGASWVAVVAMRVGFGLDLDVIDIPLHAGLIERIEREVAAFWRGVETGTPPAADYGRDGAALAALNEPDDALPPLDLTRDNRILELIAERDVAKRILDDATATKAKIDAEIVEKLAGHTVALLGDGRKITRKLQHRREHVVAASTYPVLRISKGAA